MEGRDGVGRNKSSTVVKYQKEHYNTLSLRFKKEDEVLRLLDYASKTLGITKGDYVRDALIEQFKRDRITIDMLPPDTKYIPPTPEPKGPKKYMIYMITEQYEFDDDPALRNKYIACLQTLKAAEKYVKDKLAKKVYPADWSYTIWGRNVEGSNKTEAWDTLKNLIRKEVDEDKRIGLDDNKPNYLDRINDVYPAEYTDEIKAEEGAQSQYYFEELDMSDWLEDLEEDNDDNNDNSDNDD